MSVRPSDSATTIQSMLAPSRHSCCCASCHSCCSASCAGPHEERTLLGEVEAAATAQREKQQQQLQQQQQQSHQLQQMQQQQQSHQLQQMQQQQHPRQLQQLQQNGEEEVSADLGGGAQLLSQPSQRCLVSCQQQQQRPQLLQLRDRRALPAGRSFFTAESGGCLFSDSSFFSDFLKHGT